jgi:D-alanyl-D-alanine carboxypeptidase
MSKRHTTQPLPQHAYGPLVFSILIDQPKQSELVMLAEIEQVVLQIAQLSPCV